MTSLASVRGEVNLNSFPRELIKGCKTAVCFFGAGFLGRNDGIHLLDSGIESATVVDTDPEKLETMFTLYPSTWKFENNDALLTSRVYRKAGRKFDVVTVDPWSGCTGTPLYNLPTFVGLANRFVIIGVDLAWFENKRVAPTLEAFNDWIDRAHWNGEGTPPHALELRKRSDYLGGVWWAVIPVA